MSSEGRLINRKATEVTKPARKYHVFLLPFFCFMVRSQLIGFLLGRYVHVLVALLGRNSLILFHSEHRYLKYLKLGCAR